VACKTKYNMKGKKERSIDKERERKGGKKGGQKSPQMELKEGRGKKVLRTCRTPG
jgi:hypothetical protein